ncbi:MAG: 3-hydroxyacyl-CoA dehydrogenase NAD-binding domain-containing protein [Alphaproteobacteria bacterium]|nr:3-hydroxyacyl-CoA dehydrogenase NAD-binding domain-containing protein [Alphaproteobacteria bacterium]
MSTVATSRISRTAVLTLDNAPVNGLGLALRTALVEAFQAALDDAEVSAIVLTGAGRMFSAGADITEFGTPKSRTAPALPEIIDMIEQAGKPVVAAIHGNALGGGLELALGCAWRVAAAGTNLGLPEVSLGIIPGAGGTQRLPRVIGVAPALDMIVSGKPIKAEKGLALGLVDALAEGDLVEAAVKFCQRLPAGAQALRPTRARQDKLGEAGGNAKMFEDYRAAMARRARGLEAPYAAVECVEASQAREFEAGIEFEREIFKKLVASDQSVALRHAFFVERGAAKIDGLAKDTAKQDIRRAAVIGCGTMGGGIAMNFANAGIPVTVLETADAALQKGLETIRGNYAASVAKGRIAQAKMDGCMGLIEGITDFDQLGEPDIVIEAIFEKMDIKKEVFAKLDALTPPDTILATNTSTLDVDEIASATKRPDKVIGTHFFSPANVMRLQENVRGQRTSDETIATTMALARKLGKVGVLVGVCDGFVGNRMLYAYSRQANFLLEEGALPAEVDKAIFDFGFPMGPFAMGDLAGLDVGWLVRQARAATRPSNLRYSPIADRICEMGRYGQKTSAGWYRYEKGSRVPIADPEIEKLIICVSEELGYQRRPIDEKEIIQRCMYPLINEGAKILSEGIAQRPGDIDTVWIYGYGFPRQRGGPMFYADTVGLKQIYDVMSALYDAHGEWLKPAPLLAELAAAGKGFGDL